MASTPPTPEELERKRRWKVIQLWLSLDQGLEQREVAERLGVKYTTIRGWLQEDRHGPPLDTLIELANVAQVPREFAIDGWSAITRFTDLEGRIRAIEQRNGATT